MTLAEFETKIKEYMSDNYTEGIYFNDYRNNASNMIECSWRTGGVAGGSCWETEHYDITPDKEPDIENYVFDILIELFPNMSFADSRKISKMFVEEETHDNGWYGNWSNGMYKYIMVNDIYNHFYGEKTK